MVRNLPRLVAQSTGTGSVTQGIGGLDDADSITVFLQSTGGFAHTAIQLQVNQNDVSLPVQSGVTESTAWNSYSTSVFGFTSSGQAAKITDISFRSLRLVGTSSAATSEVVAYVSKQIIV